VQSLGGLILSEMQLVLQVSSDGESMHTRLRTPSQNIDVPPRATHQVLLTLARKRIEDRDAGVADGECGWVYSDELAKMLGYDNERVNVDVHRLRQQFAHLGVLDASQLIERRPTSHQVRLGMRHVSIS
jgi:hypothetical protein